MVYITFTMNTAFSRYVACSVRAGLYKVTAFSFLDCPGLHLSTSNVRALCLQVNEVELHTKALCEKVKHEHIYKCIYLSFFCISLSLKGIQLFLTTH